MTQYDASTYTDILYLVIAVCVAAAVVSLILYIAYEIIQCFMRLGARKALNVKLPHKVRVWPSRKTRPQFTLQIPYWQFEKKDGTADRRRNGNRVIKPPSVITVGGWKLKCKNPLVAYQIVLELRKNHIRIPLIPAEQAKYARMSRQAQQQRNATDANQIVTMFESNPTGFEPFCARLLNALGYQMTVTPPTNDGGYDLIGRMNNGTTLICECKCYSPNHSVGRPLVQKLVGANMTVRAQHMFFITTSKYSAEAVEYAKRTGVTLIDGDTLAYWCRSAWGSQPQQFQPESAGWLTRAEMVNMLPADMVGMF